MRLQPIEFSTLKTSEDALFVAFPNERGYRLPASTKIRTRCNSLDSPASVRSCDSSRYSRRSEKDRAKFEGSGRGRAKPSATRSETRLALPLAHAVGKEPLEERAWVVRKESDGISRYSSLRSRAPTGRPLSRKRSNAEWKTRALFSPARGKRRHVSPIKRGIARLSRGKMTANRLISRWR